MGGVFSRRHDRCLRQTAMKVELQQTAMKAEPAFYRSESAAVGCWSIASWLMSGRSPCPTSCPVTNLGALSRGRVLSKCTRTREIWHEHFTGLMLQATADTREILMRHHTQRCRLQPYVLVVFAVVLYLRVRMCMRLPVCCFVFACEYVYAVTCICLK